MTKETAKIRKILNSILKIKLWKVIKSRYYTGDRYDIYFHNEFVSMFSYPEDLEYIKLYIIEYLRHHYLVKMNCRVKKKLDK